MLIVAGASCGGSARTTRTTASHSPVKTTSAVTTLSGSPSALQPEANAAAAGDIPDNQTFLVFHDISSRYSMKYPEGWAQKGSAGTVVFRDKNNLVRVVVSPGGAVSVATVRRDLEHLNGVKVLAAPRSLNLRGGRALKAVYSTVSAPNAVTGKRVTLVVDRYYLWRAGLRAVVDLGTPQGVDNVDAYRLMIESFRWR
jgi:hypothetical protein